MAIQLERVASLNVDDFVDVLKRSGLAQRRPVNDKDRIRRMLLHSHLIVVAREDSGQKMSGVARSLTDFSYCCYLSDLAVDQAYQGQGIGRRLIDETRALAGPESMLLLLSSPDAIGFYKAIGMPQPNNAFVYQRER